ncbi:MAG TPA: nuclear transport factor 2 family protein [bacterium]|nr:nuclear transport factor 2 family protein [bacterium]
MENKLETMELIRQRKAQYCRYLDTKQFDEWEKLFSPDVKITMYGVDGTVLRSFDSLKSFAGLTRSLFATTQTIHQVHNSEIEFKSNTEVAAIWSMEDWHIYELKDGQPSKTMHGYGHYYETWKLINDAWVITSIDLRRTILEIR